MIISGNIPLTVKMYSIIITYFYFSLITFQFEPVRFETKVLKKKLLLMLKPDSFITCLTGIPATPRFRPLLPRNIFNHQ